MARGSTSTTPTSCTSPSGPTRSCTTTCTSGWSSMTSMRCSRRLAAAGAPWTAQADLFGGRRGSTRDPLGNRIELLEPTGRLA